MNVGLGRVHNNNVYSKFVENIECTDKNVNKVPESTVRKHRIQNRVGNSVGKRFVWLVHGSRLLALAVMAVFVENA